MRSRVAAVPLLLALAACGGSGAGGATRAGVAPAPAGPAGAAAPAAPAAPAGSAASYAPVVPPTPHVPDGAGVLRTVGGGTGRAGEGPLRRYTVAVEQGLGVDEAGFARAVDEVLADPRSWTAGAQVSFQRVPTGPAEFRVVLASPELTDRLCAPLHTDGDVSCRVGADAGINVKRWRRGATPYAGRLSEYRAYVVNHEVGHVLGHGHTSCPRPGELAPVMVQQTLGVGACRPNPWPYPP